MSIGKNIRKIRERLNMTQLELAEALGYKSKTTITKIESDKNELNQSKIIAFAEALNVNPSDLLELDDDEDSVFKPIRVPVFGTIPAGVPVEDIEEIDSYEELDPRKFNPSHDYFALKVKGDSMYPRLIDGDIVILKQQPTCESGSIAAVYVNGYDTTLKQVIFNNDGTITLKPFNTNYDPITYDEVVILGIVKELRRKF